MVPWLLTTYKSWDDPPSTQFLFTQKDVSFRVFPQHFAQLPSHAATLPAFGGIETSWSYGTQLGGHGFEGLLGCLPFNTHTIHGTNGIFTYMKTIKQSTIHVGKCARPMDSIWVMFILFDLMCFSLCLFFKVSFDSMCFGLFFQGERCHGKVLGGWESLQQISLTVSGCCFHTCFIFTPIWGRFPFWLISFKGVETSNWVWVDELSCLFLFPTVMSCWYLGSMDVL